MRHHILGVAAGVALSGSAVAGVPVNVLQDCWTTDVPPVELEFYDFAVSAGQPVVFVWKHKILESCQNYTFSIFGFDCLPGKPRPSNARWGFRDQSLGPIQADPAVPEQLLTFVAPPGAIPPGLWDWVLVAECNDVNTPGIPFGPDGDADDECGVNVGRAPGYPAGPVVFGFEPTEMFDVDPGGWPPGRLLGESGTTRPGCFVAR
jgi:hypothetical protein